MRKILILTTLLAVSSLVLAQDYRVDLNIRGAALMLDDPDDDAYGRDGAITILASAEALYFLKDYVGVGAYYTRSVIPGEYEFYNGGGYYTYDYSQYEFASYGASLQLTTSRKKRFRVYIVGRAGLTEILEDFEDYKVGSSAFSYSGGLGVMIKLSRRVSFNLFEANYLSMPKELALNKVNPITGLSAQTGFSVKIIRKK